MARDAADGPEISAYPNARNALDSGSRCRRHRTAVVPDAATSNLRIESSGTAPGFDSSATGSFPTNTEIVVFEYNVGIAGAADDEEEVADEDEDDGSGVAGAGGANEARGAGTGGPRIGGGA